MSTTKRKKKDKAADYAALAALGIARVEVSYDGCSDSGPISSQRCAPMRVAPTSSTPTSKINATA